LTVLLLVRKNIDVNGHGRSSNITRRYKLKSIGIVVLLLFYISQSQQGLQQ